MKALDRKLLRDLRLMWSQALTIALVVASGIGGFVTTLSAVDSLALARDHFYAQGRFADAHAAPVRLSWRADAGNPADATARRVVGARPAAVGFDRFCEKRCDKAGAAGPVGACDQEILCDHGGHAGKKSRNDR